MIGDERLTLVSKARANQVLLNGQQRSDRIRQDGKVHQAKATHEVVLTAEASTTPKLLMLSGSTPRSPRPVQHPSRRRPAGVGQNLQDHNEVFLSLSTKGPFRYLRRDADQADPERRSVFRFSHRPHRFHGIRDDGVRQFDDPAGPPISKSVHWSDVADADGQTARRRYASGQFDSPAFLQVRPLKSALPEDDAEVDPNSMTIRRTRDACEALETLRTIVATAPFIDIVEEELSPGQAITDDAELVEYMKATTQSNLHPVGACRMGRAEDPTTMVTPDLRVKG